MSPVTILLVALIIGLWIAFFDADFITFTYDLHRQITKYPDIANKSVWVVGASSGIGEFLIYELVQSGCNKIILSSRRSKQLERVKSEALKINSDAQIIIKPLDLLDFATKNGYNDRFVKDLTRELPSTFNGIDILVVNSGMIQVGYGIDNNIDVLHRVLNINTVGPISLIQSMIRYWYKIDPKGNKKYQIALTSSIAGKIGSPQQTAYSMSKFGINGYLEALRMEIMDENIDINIFNPGHIEVNKYSLPSTGSSLDKDEEYERGHFNDEMTLKRCAELYVTLLEYSITDSIVSTNPLLIFTYIKQYLPGIFHPFTKLILPSFDPYYARPRY